MKLASHMGNFNKALKRTAFSRRLAKFVNVSCVPSIHASLCDCTFPCFQNKVDPLAVRHFQPERTHYSNHSPPWIGRCAMGAGAVLPLAVGLSRGGDHLSGGAGDCQARLVAAHTLACSGRFVLCAIRHAGPQRRARGGQACAAGSHRQSER